jgi:glucose-6-phosphate 1-dehydrogenase
MPTIEYDPVIVIFGITGDLSKRKLLPALYDLFKENILHQDTKIIGTSRHELDKSNILESENIASLEPNKQADPEIIEKLNKAFSTIQIDPEKDADYEKLKSRLDEFDNFGKRQRLFYMSIPSSAYEPIVKRLGSHGLNDERSRVLLEKPFGHDLKSAEESIEAVHQVFKENQIYRIDHYLAKETAQNLISFRANNPIFADIWNGQHIKSVHVRQFETLDIEGRKDFYEQTGALRDVIQSHLMQLLAVTLMGSASIKSAEEIHASKQTFLDALQPADPSLAVRAQYDGYKQAVGNPESFVETYAKFTLKGGGEWSNTQIIIEHGKAMYESVADITIEFVSGSTSEASNKLVFEVQPNEGINLSLQVKQPGLDEEIKQESLDFRYRDGFEGLKIYDAYEKVIVDAIEGDQSLFASDEEVLASWRAVEPVVELWNASGEGLKAYAANSKPFKLN